MKEKSFEDITNKLKLFKPEEDFDLVVAVAHGGIVPGYLIAGHLKLPIEFVWINFRDEHNNPQRKSPAIVKPIEFDATGKNILLVDDRSNTGVTLEFAKTILKDAALVKTMVINGRADYVLFDEDCFGMPWNI